MASIPRFTAGSTWTSTSPFTSGPGTRSRLWFPTKANRTRARGAARRIGPPATRANTGVERKARRARRADPVTASPPCPLGQRQLLPRWQRRLVDIETHGHQHVEAVDG